MRVFALVAGLLAILVAIAAGVDVATSDPPATCGIRRFALLPDRCEGTCPEGACTTTSTQCYISIFGACLATQPNSCACPWAPGP